MKDINYWERFLMTGSVSDFLSYKNALRDVDTDQGSDKQDIVGKDKSGGQSHAGVYGSYRDGFKG